MVNLLAPFRIRVEPGWQEFLSGGVFQRGLNAIIAQFEARKRFPRYAGVDQALPIAYSGPRLNRSAHELLGDESHQDPGHARPVAGNPAPGRRQADLALLELADAVGDVFFSQKRLPVPGDIR